MTGEGVVPGQNRGFTLVELAIVLAVIGILSTIIVPDFIASMRNQMGKRVVEDIRQIASAAQWAYIESASPDRPQDAAWPGYRADCTFASTAIDALVSQGYLAVRPKDPWGGFYAIRLSGSCALEIQTANGTIPAVLHGYIESQLTQVDCDAGVCTATFPKPGVMASANQIVESCCPCNP